MGKSILITELEYEINKSPSKEVFLEDSKIKEQLKIKTKNLKSLESNLIDFFIDPLDSFYRRRYIKRFIYGENIKTNNAVIKH